MMKNIIFLFPIIIGVVLISCNNPTQIPTYNLNPILSVCEFGDSVFISNIRSIYFSNKTYYLTDYERNKVYILDKDLNLLKYFGKEGRGPGELFGTSQIYVKEDSIYIYNDSKNAIELFNDDNYIKTIHLTHDINYEGDTRLVLEDHSIFISNPTECSSISRFSFNGIFLNNFGETKYYKTEKETTIKNFKHLCFLNDKIIAVSNCNPNIEIYNTKGEKVSEYDFSHLLIVKKLMKFIKIQNLSSNSYYVIVSDIYLSDNYLFLLILSVNKENEIESNKILQFEFKGQILKPLRILDLGKGWFAPICIAGDQIVAFNHITSDITKYNLP